MQHVGSLFLIWIRESQSIVVSLKEGLFTNTNVCSAHHSETGLASSNEHTSAAILLCIIMASGS